MERLIFTKRPRYTVREVLECAALAALIVTPLLFWS